MTEQIGHVDPHVLHEMAAGGLDSDQAQSVNEHLADCGRCRAEFALAGSFAEAVSAEVARPAPTTGSGLRRAPVWRMARWGLLAASVALVAIGVREFRAPAPPSPVSDGVVRGPARGSAWVAQVESAPGGWLVEWPAEDGATSYTVEFLGADGLPVWTASTDATRMVVPSSAAPEGAGTLFVRVRARLESGGERLSGVAELPGR